MKKMNVKNLVLTAILLAIVIVLQVVATLFPSPIFKLTLVLIPISVAGILLGSTIAGFLGFVFGIIVILSGDAAYFMGFNAIATVIIVLLKGTMSGYGSGIVYRLIKNKNIRIAKYAASIITPIINTGIFAIGVILFLMPAVEPLVSDGGNAYTYLFTIMIGSNFLIEMLISVILSPTVSRICEIGMKNFDIQ